MPVFQLNCLGTPQLVAPSGDPIRFRTRKHLALLVHQLPFRFPSACRTGPQVLSVRM